MRAKNSLRTSLIALVLLLSFCPPLPLQAAASGWFMQQKSDKSGRAEVWISPEGIKISSQLVSAIVKAPKYNAVLFNERTKRYFDVPYEDWSGRYKQNKRSINGPLASAKIAGLNSKKYVCPPGKKNRHKTQEIWTTADLAISRQLTDFVLHNFGLPAGLGLPLKVVSVYDNKTSRVDMDTVSVKKTSISPSVFQIPKGFKKVDNEMELLLNTDSSDELDSFLR